MLDFGWREPALTECLRPSPARSVLLTARPQRVAPQAFNLGAKRADARVFKEATGFAPEVSEVEALRAYAKMTAPR